MPRLKRMKTDAITAGVFISHFGLGFAAKKAAPVVSLGALFLAS